MLYGVVILFFFINLYTAWRISFILTPELLEVSVLTLVIYSHLIFIAVSLLYICSLWVLRGKITHENIKNWTRVQVYGLLFTGILLLCVNMFSVFLITTLSAKKILYAYGSVRVVRKKYHSYELYVYRMRKLEEHDVEYSKLPPALKKVLKAAQSFSEVDEILSNYLKAQNASAWSRLVGYIYDQIKGNEWLVGTVLLLSALGTLGTLGTVYYGIVCWTKVNTVSPKELAEVTTLLTNIAQNHHTLITRITSSETAITALETNMANITGQLETNMADITGQLTNMANLTGQLQTNMANLTGQWQSDMANVSGRLNSVKPMFEEQAKDYIFLMQYVRENLEDVMSRLISHRQLLEIVEEQIKAINKKIWD